MRNRLREALGHLWTSLWKRRGPVAVGTDEESRGRAYARARFGHSWNAWGQARAAYRYFRASGSNWGPWACKP